MTLTLVRYRTRPETADENERLIGAVFRELQSTQPDGVRYVAMRLPGAEFVHLAGFDAGAIALTDLAAFQAFRAGGRDRWIDPPQPLEASLIGAFGESFSRARSS